MHIETNSNGTSRSTSSSISSHHQHKPANRYVNSKASGIDDTVVDSLSTDFTLKSILKPGTLKFYAQRQPQADESKSGSQPSESHTSSLNGSFTLDTPPGSQVSHLSTLGYSSSYTSPCTISSSPMAPAPPPPSQSNHTAQSYSGYNGHVSPPGDTSPHVLQEYRGANGLGDLDNDLFPSSPVSLNEYNLSEYRSVESMPTPATISSMTLPSSTSSSSTSSSSSSTTSSAFQPGAATLPPPPHNMALSSKLCSGGGGGGGELNDLTIIPSTTATAGQTMSSSSANCQSTIVNNIQSTVTNEYQSVLPTQLSHESGDQFQSTPLPATAAISQTAAESQSSAPVAAPGAGGRRRKSVTFADDRGFDLSDIRVMTEESSEPPNISRSSSRLGGRDELSLEYLELKLAFAQPVADYVAFRERIDKFYVALENVMINGNSIKGTIKVKNIAFDKQVHLRVTLDEWKTASDYSCSYLNSTSRNVDTFAFEFKVNLATMKERLMFCVRYLCNDREYWDNYHGHNYVINMIDTQPDEPGPHGYQINSKDGSVASSYYTEYAAWRDISDGTPYW